MSTPIIKMNLQDNNKESRDTRLKSEHNDSILSIKSKGSTKQTFKAEKMYSIADIINEPDVLRFSQNGLTKIITPQIKTDDKELEAT